VTRLSEGFTSTNIESIVKDMEQDTSGDITEVEINLMKSLLSFIPMNINTALQTYQDKMSSAMTDYNKDLSSATKGMDYKSAVEMANTLGISVTKDNFDIREGSLYLKDLNLLYNHYFGESGIGAEIVEKAKKTRDVIKENLDKFTEVTEESNFDQLATDLELDSPIDLKNFVIAWKKSGQELSQFITGSYFEDLISGLTSMTTEMRESIDLKAAMDSGKLKNVVRAALPKDASESTVKSFISAITQSLADGDLSKMDPEM